MEKGDKYNIDTDPDFDANFYKNIEKVLSDAFIEAAEGDDAAAREEAAAASEAAPKAEAELTEELAFAADVMAEEEGTPEGEADADEKQALTVDATAGEEAILAEEADADEKLASTAEAMAGEKAVLAEEAAIREELASVVEAMIGDEPAPEGEAAQAKDAILADEASSADETAAAVEAKLEDVPNLADQELAEEELNHSVDDALMDINASLAKQINEELSNQDTQKKKKTSKVKIVIGVVAAVLACLIGFGAFLAFTDPGHQMLINLSGGIWEARTNTFEKNPVMAAEDIDHIEDEDLATDEEDIDPATIKWPEHPGYGRQEEGVYNILLLGEEAIGSGSARGRTDVIIIATMNTNTKELKLTSLMRDTLVRIPGYQENKLNTAYEKGGLDLLYETIAVNYDIRLDGCVMVNFESFEKIIDQLGGVEITLTASEAKYLNRTNYISKPQYRTVVEGKQVLNGNQALGYSRIRKRANINGTNNDYGRTERHRIILDAIFEKYKSKSKLELASLMYSFLPMITTDIEGDTFEILLNKFLEMGTTKIDQLRLPADGTFTDNVEVRGMDVLIPDWDKNITLLHNFIFGDDKPATNGN